MPMRCHALLPCELCFQQNCTASTQLSVPAQVQAHKQLRPAAVTARDAIPAYRGTPAVRISPTHGSASRPPQ